MDALLDWLLEQDEGNPGVRYFALKLLAGCSDSDPELQDARRAIMERGPVPAILAQQHEAGYWVKAGAGYYPKYRGTAWSVIYLAQLGADPKNPQTQAAGSYLLDHAVARTGVFTYTGTPAGNINCLAGNLGAALLDLRFGDDERLIKSLDLVARFATGEGVSSSNEKKAPLHYFRSGTCGPGFRCSANNRMPCAWGAVKVLRALARLPEKVRTPTINRAVQATVEFLLNVDPATADYPGGYSDKPSRSWFRFGFPVFYVTDVLQIAEVLTEAGYGGDPRLAATYDLVLGKRDSAGRWRMEYSYRGKTWCDAEQHGAPSKWVTLRALRVLHGGGLLP
jgi:hypothetical protein